MEQIRQTARRYAVKNAFEHDGKAQAGAVVGKVKALFPNADLKLAAPEIAKIVAEVNKLKKDTLKEEYDLYTNEGWELKHVEKEKTLPELSWIKAGEKIITRVAPNPSGAMHFGHARPAVLTDEYVKKYGGKLILRFDDTDPKTKTPVEGIEKEFIKDFEWLGIHFDEIQRSSDRLERYYEVIERLLKEGKAYICECESEKWRELIWKSKPCPCRERSASEQLSDWRKMLTHVIRESEAVVRIKTDLKDPDPSTRDWWLAKVVDNINHTNKKVLDKHVWPSYNLASAVDDYDMHVNYTIRGQEHVTNGEKQKELFLLMGWKGHPKNDYFGKISTLGDMVLSKSKMKLIMEKEGVTRYDDPRMITIMALRRRGFRPEAIRKIILDAGISMKELKITTENFASANKLFLGEVDEFPFFESVLEIEITQMVEGHGDGYGDLINFKGGIEKFIVEKKELLKYLPQKGKSPVIRFKKAFNARITAVDEYRGEAIFLSYDKTEFPVISWIKNAVDVEILMNDGSIKKGFSAKTLLHKKGVVRFESVGYANIEEIKGNTIYCVFAHE